MTSDVASNVSEIMKGIDVSSIHVDMPLSNMSLAYMQAESEFIADKWFPIVSVPAISGVYYRYDKDTFFRNRVNKWSPGSKMTQGMMNIDHTGSYSCQFRAYEHPLPAHLAAAQDSMVMLERSITELVTRTLMLDREIQIAGDFFTTGKFTSNEFTGAVSGAYTHWDDYANSDVLANIKYAKLQVKKAGGMTPNTMVVNEQVFEALRLHPQLKEIYKYTQPAVMTEDLIGKAVGVQKILIGQALKETAAEGVASVLDYVWGKHAFVGYVAPSVGLMVPTCGMIASWTGMTGGFNTAIERVPDRRVHADFFQGYQCYDDIMVAESMGSLFYGIIS